MAIRNRDKTRARILKVSLDKFAEKGFSAATIKSIAEQACVNQALIYYYFKSKKEILEEIIDTFIETANGFLFEIFINEYQYGSSEMLEQMNQYNKYLLENDKTLRLILTESLKDENEFPPIFRLIYSSNETNVDFLEKMEQKGFKFGSDINQFMVTEFFTGIIPIMIFSLFKKKWCSSFNIDQKELEKMFNKANTATHDKINTGIE